MEMSPFARDWVGVKERAMIASGHGLDGPELAAGLGRSVLASLCPKFQTRDSSPNHQTRHIALFLSLSPPLYTGNMANNAISSQPALKSEGIAALPHTEAHYFNRCAPVPLSAWGLC